MSVAEASKRTALKNVVDRPLAEDGLPHGWLQTTIGQLIQLGGSIKTGPFGTVFRASEYSQDGVPVVAVGNIGSGRLAITDETPRVPPQVIRRLPAYRLKAGDIVFGRKGAVERSALIRSEEDGWFLGSDAIRIRLPEAALPEYVVYQLQRNETQTWLLANSIGTTMPSLNQSVLERVPLVLAPPEEQRAIAAALSDVDTLIAVLDEVIAKNRAIKLATMQQLLTSRIRLPGFSERWTLLNVAKNSLIKGRIGWQGLTTSEYRPTGTYRLVTGTDFAQGKIEWSRCVFVDEPRYAQDSNIQLKVGDVLLTKDGTIGKAGFVDTLPGPATLNSGIFVIRPKNGEYDPLYFYYVLNSGIFDEFLSRLQAGSTIVHLYQKDFIGFEFTAPHVSEQRAITAVLSNMDSEIAGLERIREKVQAIKRGMMQALLTGRIRLGQAEPPPEPVS